MLAKTDYIGVQHREGCPQQGEKKLRRVWQTPKLSKLDVSKTFGFGGPKADSDGSPSDKS